MRAVSPFLAALIGCALSLGTLLPSAQAQTVNYDFTMQSGNYTLVGEFDGLQAAGTSLVSALVLDSVFANTAPADNLLGDAQTFTNLDLPVLGLGGAQSIPAPSTAMSVSIDGDGSLSIAGGQQGLFIANGPSAVGFINFGANEFSVVVNAQPFVGGATDTVTTTFSPATTSSSSTDVASVAEPQSGSMGLAALTVLAWAGLTLRRARRD